jgi:hypothetical protein
VKYVWLFAWDWRIVASAAPCLRRAWLVVEQRIRPQIAVPKYGAVVSEKTNGDTRSAGFAGGVSPAESVFLDETRSVARTRSVFIPLNSLRARFDLRVQALLTCALSTHEGNISCR